FGAFCHNLTAQPCINEMKAIQCLCVRVCVCRCVCVCVCVRVCVVVCGGVWRWCRGVWRCVGVCGGGVVGCGGVVGGCGGGVVERSEEHTSELQSHLNLVCRLLLAKKKVIATRCIGDWLRYKTHGPLALRRAV